MISTTARGAALRAARCAAGARGAVVPRTSPLYAQQQSPQALPQHLPLRLHSGEVGTHFFSRSFFDQAGGRHQGGVGGISGMGNIIGAGGGGARGGYSNYNLPSPLFPLRVVPQQSAWVVERFGKFHTVLEPGLHLLVPIVDRIAYVALPLLCAVAGLICAARFCGSGGG